MGGMGEFSRNGDGASFGSSSTAQLALDDEDDRLPWLESGDDDVEEGVDTGRLVGFALIGLVALAAIVGLIWWLGNRGASPDLIADGRTIEAPDAPYKTRPENPGGKEFAGTGDTSFKVGEGASTDSKLATAAVAKPVVNAEQADSAGAKADDTANVPGVGVQVGAYNSKEQAQAGWSTLYTANEALHGYKYRIVQGTADIGTVFRLQAVTGDAASAEALCARLKAAGTACQVKR